MDVKKTKGTTVYYWWDCKLELWPSAEKSQLIGKDPDARKDWGQEKKGVKEEKMVRWHHWLNGHEFEKLQEIVKDREAWYAAIHEVTKSWHDLAPEQ